MKNNLFKVFAATAMVSMICSCGDDSGSDVGTPAENATQSACAKYAVFGQGWVLEMGQIGYWVLDEATALAGQGKLIDQAGETVSNAYFVIEGSTANIFQDGELFMTADLEALQKCPANATKDPDTGEILVSSAAAPASSATVPQSNGNQSSADAPLSSGSAPLSSAGTNPGSSVAQPGSSGSVVPGSSADVVPESSSSKDPDLDENGFPTLESYGDPPAAYTKDILNNGKTGWSSRYWDACKPHCSWLSSVDTTSEEKYQAGRTVARNCNIHDVEVPAFTLGHAVQQYWMGYEGTNSACVNNNAGGTYTCTDMAPIQVTENLSYGYVAAPGAQFGGGCGKCFHLQFNGGNHANDVKETHLALKGKHMVVMASNIGHDVEAGQYDMMVPGGGVGAFNALSTQIGVPASGLGANGGGFLTECQQSLGWDNTVEAYQQCVIKKCDEVFKDWPNLLRGCKWYAEWFMAADNPTYNWEEVECPQYLIDHYLTTFNTTLENRWRWHDDWSDYKKGDVLDTVYCWKDGENPNDPNGKGAGCAP